MEKCLLKGVTRAPWGEGPKARLSGHPEKRLCAKMGNGVDTVKVLCLRSASKRDKSPRIEVGDGLFSAIGEGESDTKKDKRRSFCRKAGFLRQEREC